MSPLHTFLSSWVVFTIDQHQCTVIITLPQLWSQVLTLQSNWATFNILSFSKLSAQPFSRSQIVQYIWHVSIDILSLKPLNTGVSSSSFSPTWSGSLAANACMKVSVVDKKLIINHCIVWLRILLLILSCSSIVAPHESHQLIYFLLQQL